MNTVNPGHMDVIPFAVLRIEIEYTIIGFDNQIEPVSTVRLYDFNVYRSSVSDQALYATDECVA